MAEATLTIDLDAIGANWRALRTIASPAECSPVVKAGAYGLGLEPVARRLWSEGARTFFVANAGEGEALRALLPQSAIFVLNGFQPGEAARLSRANLRPVLNSYAQFEEWRGLDQRPPAAIQIDTGINRTGMSADDLDALTRPADPFAGVEVSLIMSHLACADQPLHARNGEQLTRFREALSRLPRRPVSLAASAGVFLGRPYIFDMIRPGIALYGGNPRAEPENPMRAVVTLEAPIVQIRRVDSGEGVGYGATYRTERPTLLATAAIGYADGIMRSLSNRGYAFIAGHRAPIAGRVSMDLVTLDITHVPDSAVRAGTSVEFIGPSISLDEVAAAAGTANYELLTGLGPRLARVYKGAKGARP